MKQIENPVRLKDTLHHLDVSSGASVEYCKGIVNGVVSTLMAFGYSYKDAIAQVAIHMPSEETHPRYAVPDAWLNDLMAARLAIEPLKRGRK